MPFSTPESNLKSNKMHLWIRFFSPGMLLVRGEKPNAGRKQRLARRNGIFAFFYDTARVMCFPS